LGAHPITIWGFHCGCGWVFVIKGPDGIIDRFKTHIVTKGYTKFLFRLQWYLFSSSQNGFCSLIYSHGCSSIMASLPTGCQKCFS